MYKVMDEAFVHLVSKKIEDCSNPIQLSAYLRRFAGYTFVPAIAEMFYTKNNAFKELCIDDVYLNACEDIDDMLDLDIQIANVCSNGMVDSHQDNNDRRLIKSIVNDQEMGVETISYKELRKYLRYNEFDLKETALELEISFKEIKYLVKYYNLGKYIKN